MLPAEDAEWVGAELSRRFGLPRWSFSLSTGTEGLGEYFHLYLCNPGVLLPRSTTLP